MNMLYDPLDAREEIVETAKKLCLKFVKKVEFGKARSVETYQDCKTLLELIERYEEEKRK